jgi:methionyl-tRNA formyltransferase
MGLKVALIGTDTLHRSFIISKLLKLGINIKVCIFQTKPLQPIFDTRPTWEKNELHDLNLAFSSEINLEYNNHCKAFYVDELNADNVIEILKAQEIEFFIVSGAGFIKNQLLQFIKGNSLNVHMGNASEYRGLDTNLWAIYHGEYKNIGITLHALDENLDTGEIYRYAPLKLEKDIPIWMLRYYETNLAVQMLYKACVESEKGRVQLREQKKIGRYYSFMPGNIKNSLPKILKSEKFKY